MASISETSIGALGRRKPVSASASRPTWASFTRPEANTTRRGSATPIDFASSIRLALRRLHRRFFSAQSSTDRIRFARFSICFEDWARRAECIPRSCENEPEGRRFEERPNEPEGRRFEERPNEPEGRRFEERPNEPEGRRFEERPNEPEGRC